MKISLDAETCTVTVEADNKGKITSQTVETVLLYHILKKLCESAGHSIEGVVLND